MRGGKIWLFSAHLASIILNTINLQTILYKPTVRRVGTFTKPQIVTGILAALVLLESGYIVLRRHPTNRFKPMDEDGYLAFDSATGQLCRTFRPGPPPKKIPPNPIEPAPSSLDSQKSNPKVDPVLNAIRGGLTEAEFDKKVQSEKAANAEAQAEFIRHLPACADIR